MGMSGAIDRLSTKGRKAAVGFSTVSSRKWDQTYSRAARPAISSLGGQEISSDPPFYDPQLSASGRLGGLEVGQQHRDRRRPKKQNKKKARKCNLIGQHFGQLSRWEKL